MKTPTLVLATILAMAVVGDSANMEKILQQLGFPTGKEPADSVNTNPKGEAQEKGKGAKFTAGPAKAPDLVKDHASQKSGPKGKESIHDISMILADGVPKVKGGTKFTFAPTQAGNPADAITHAPKGKQLIQKIATHPASESPPVTQGKEVTSRPTQAPNPVTTITPVLENVAPEGNEPIGDTTMPPAEVTEGTKLSPRTTQGLNPVNAITSAPEDVAQEGQSTPFIPGTLGSGTVYETKTPEKAKRKKSPSDLAKPLARPSQKSKPKVAAPPVKQNYDWYDWYNYEDAGSGENYVNKNGDYSNKERGIDANIDDTFLVRDGGHDTGDYMYDDGGSGENYAYETTNYNEERGIDANVYDTFLVRDGGHETDDYMYSDGGSGDNSVYTTIDYNEERGLDSTIKDSDFEDGSAEIEIHGAGGGKAAHLMDGTNDKLLRGVSSRPAKRIEPVVKKSLAKAILAKAGERVAMKVTDKLVDSITDGLLEGSNKGKVVSGLNNYLGQQMDKFDNEYKGLLKDTSGLAAGSNRPVEEADIQLVPNPGGMMGNMYAPPGWEIRHKYKYKDDSNKDKSSSGGPAAAFTYPAGLGPVLMNGCFGTGYKNGDPCYKAKIPRTGCPNLIDGATYLGVGFDGRGVYTAESRTKSVIQRSCSNLQTYGENEVPDLMTVQGIYDTDVESHTFSSLEEYRRYLEKKSAVTSAKAMFQEEIEKASGYDAQGGIVHASGHGSSSQNGDSSQSSGFNTSSSAEGQLENKQTQTFMAMLEMNIFRYEIFMDDVKPEQLSVGFLRDFVLLPESYFSPGAEIIFQNFYLRWGTHYIKSAKFGGQLKIIKTKEATQDLSLSEFATRAEADWKMTLSTFSAQASHSQASSWWRKTADLKAESKQSSGQANAGSKLESNKNLERQTSSQEYNNEVLVVQGGDQQIAAVITEMYTTALTTELKDWLESIKDFPKPFSFVLRPVSDLLNIPFDSLFPAGDVDYGCFGTRNLKIEEETGRRYYTQETAQPDIGNTATSNSSKPVRVSEIRYCDFKDRKEFKDSMMKRRLALERAVTVYLEEGRLLSSDFVLPAGDSGCETAVLAYLHDSKVGVPTWQEMIGGKEFTVIFDMPYDIPGILQAQDELELKFISHMWFSTKSGAVPHLYDGYKNGGSNDVKAKKVSVQGLVMTYDEETGIFTVTEDDFKASAPLLPNLREWVKGRGIARAEYKKLLNHLGRKIETIGDVPCSIQWSNAHRLDPSNGGKCIHFTAASEGDIFVVFASIPQSHETWIYIQISPEGVALYKAMRLQTIQLNNNAGGLGSSTLYQSYFVCVTEDRKKKTTVIQYGKLPDNEERPHVWLGFTFYELAYLRYYSFGNGATPVKVMGLSLMDKPAKDFIICREGTEMINGICRQKCHSECKGCRTSGSNSSSDCIACKHVKVSRNGLIGKFECLAQCPPHMKVVSATKTCTCIRRMEEAHSYGVVNCLTECPLTHFDDNNVCKKCSSFCQETHAVRKRVCSGPASTDCDTCKYQHEGRCVKECKPGQKAVKTGENGAFTCHQCQPGYECKLGDELEDICPAGTASNDNRTLCVPCAAGEFSSSQGAASCQKCPAGKYSTGGGSTSCLSCPAGKYTSAVGSTGCTICSEGKYNSRVGSDSCTPCPVGKYSDTKESRGCKPCPTGKYGSKMGSTSCMDCPVGKYSSGLGAPSCADCPFGQYSDTAGSNNCKACPVGQYNSIMGATSCTDCPLGQFSSTTGSVSCMDCPAGKYGNKVKSMNCMDCPAGKYNNKVGSTSCNDCPAGKSSKAGATSCTECPVGQYSNTAGSICTQCPAGKYNNQVGSTSCNDCPAGKSSKVGATSCTECPVGQYSNTDGSICTQCPAGKYNNKVGSTSCTRCPAGQYSNRLGAKSCSACPAGKYSKAGSRSCTTCPSGLVSRRGSSKCTCPPGYTRYQRSCFRSFPSPKNNQAAKSDCRTDGGYLAMPKDSGTNTFLARLGNKIIRRGKFYIGLKDVSAKGWHYDDSSKLGRFRNWAPGEPNNYRGRREDCVVLFWNGRWNDDNCARAFRYHCEVKLPRGHY